MQSSMNGGIACASVATGRLRFCAPLPRTSSQVGSGHR
jgi:hypothetical protein